MKEIMDGFEGVSAKLQEGVDRAIAGAKSAFEKIMQKRINEYHMRNGVTMRNPESVYIEDGVEMVKDGAQNLYERAKPTIDKTIDNIMEHTKDAPAEPDVRDEISREVDEQLNKIHQSTVTPTPFSEYIRETYGKKKD